MLAWCPAHSRCSSNAHCIQLKMGRQKSPSHPILQDPAWGGNLQDALLGHKFPCPCMSRPTGGLWRGRGHLSPAAGLLASVTLSHRDSPRPSSRNEWSEASRWPRVAPSPGPHSLGLSFPISSTWSVSLSPTPSRTFRALKGRERRVVKILTLPLRQGISQAEASRAGTGSWSPRH